MRTAVEVVGIMSVAYALAINVCYLLLWPLARRGMKRTIRRRGWAWHEEALSSPLTPGVSILVPAFNEETVILDSVASLLGQRYPVFEIVIVDDGSTDATAARTIEAHGLRRVEPAPGTCSSTNRCASSTAVARRSTSPSSARTTAAAPTP